MINITILKSSNSPLPSHSDCTLGDLVMLYNGDVFCFLGDSWKLMGGRWVPPAIKQSFFGYIRSGWPDSKSLAFDLDAVFKLSVFEVVTDMPESSNSDIKDNPIWINNFSKAIIETCVLLEKKLATSSLLPS